MQTKAGYLGHKLHNSLRPDATFRFVNVAPWALIAQFEAAHDAGFCELVGQPAWSAFRHHPVLYEGVHEAQASIISV